MAKPGVSPPPWAQAGLYPASLYPVFLPWGDPNPVGGQATPWSSQPRLMAVGLAAFADAGLTPQIPTPASPFNSWLSLVQELSQWSFDGTSDPDADAHVMETDAIGLSKALGYEATASFQGAGGTPAPLANGATIPAGMELELVGNAKVAATNAATLETGILEFKTGGPAPTVRQMAVNTSDLPVFNDGAGKFMHISVNGYVYATGDQEAATGLAAAHFIAQTTVRVTALGLGKVRVIVEGWGQTAGTGGTISVEGDDGGGIFAIIGAARPDTWVGVADPNLWSFFRLERVYTAGTLINRFYRCHIVGNGGLANVREVNLRVVPERS